MSSETPASASRHLLPSETVDSASPPTLHPNSLFHSRPQDASVTDPALEQVAPEQEAVPETSESDAAAVAAAAAAAAAADASSAAQTITELATAATNAANSAPVDASASRLSSPSLLPDATSQPVDATNAPDAGAVEGADASDKPQANAEGSTDAAASEAQVDGQTDALLLSPLPLLRKKQSRVFHATSSPSSGTSTPSRAPLPTSVSLTSTRSTFRLPRRSHHHSEGPQAHFLSQHASRPARGSSPSA